MCNMRYVPSPLNSSPAAWGKRRHGMLQPQSTNFIEADITLFESPLWSHTVSAPPESRVTCSLHPSSSAPCVPAALGCTASWVQLRPCQNPIWNMSSTSLESNGFHWTELWPAVCRQSVTYWWSRTPYVAFQIKWYKECDSVEKHLSLAIFSTLH